MEGQLAAPLHFAVEFLILAVFAGAMFDAVRSSRESAGLSAYVQAVGFATLILAQIIHGTLILTGDGALALVIMRAIGFGLIAASLRATPAAGLPALFVAGPHAGWAAVPAAFALIAAARAFAIRRSSPNAAGYALAASFLAFGGGEISLALAGPGGGPALTISHVARALGAILLARWLWISLARSLRLRFVAVFVAALVLLASVIAGALTQVIGHNLEQAEFVRLGLASAGQKTTLGQVEVQAIQYAALLGTSNTVANAYRSGGRQLTDFARASIANLPADLDFVAFFDARGRMIASATARSRSYPPLDKLQAIALSGSESIVAVLSKTREAGELTSSGAKEISAIGAARVSDPSDPQRVIGAVVVGYTLNHSLLLRLQTGAEAQITVIKGGEVLATSYSAPAASVALVAGGLSDTVRRVVEEEGGNYTATASLGNAATFVNYSPLRTHNDDQIAGVLALSSPAGLLTASQRAINRTLFLVTLIASAIAASLAWLLSGRVARPIRALTHAVGRVRAGDLDARSPIDQPDEVGALGQAFNDMAQSLTRMTGDLRNAADEEANLRARMEAIMQSMRDGLVAMNGEGIVVTVNRAAESMLGRSSDELIGRTIFDVLPGTDDEGRPVADLALAGNGAQAHATVTSADGRRLPVALSGAPLRDASGVTVGRVVLMRDVTREQEAERMKSEFLSNVSHELRTPLTPIKGYTEILRRKRFPRAKTETFLDGIAESTKRLERIVEILVDFAALEAGRLKPHIEPLDVRTFLAGVLDPWKGRSDRHRFVRQIPVGLPQLLGDARLLRKCLDEVIDNAVKFSPTGGSIEVSASPYQANGRRRGVGSIRITVRDQGIGIEPSQMGRLFQDFRQLDGSETRSFGGLGLGLSYARRVAQAHHGDITAVSEPGRGSVFTLEFPAAQPAKAPKPKPRAVAPRSSSASAKADRAPARIRRTRPISTGTRTPAGRKKVAAAAARRKKRTR